MITNAFLLLLSLATLTGFSTEDKKEVSIVLALNDCAAQNTTAYLYEFDGFNFRAVGETVLKDGAGTLLAPRTKAPRMYYVGTAPNNLKPVLIGTEARLTLTGDCLKVSNAKMESPVNQRYEEVKQEMTDLIKRSNQLSNRYRRTPEDETEARADIEGLMADLDREKFQYLEKMRKEDNFLGGMLELNTYFAYPSNKEGYDSEVQYFADKYYQHADWADKDYAYQSWVYESTKMYATTLSSVNLPAKEQAQYLDKVLASVPPGTRQRKLAYGGLLAGLESKSQPNYAKYAERAVEEFKEDTELVEALQRKIKQVAMASGGGGGMAPDFKQATPEGPEMSLSDLRGKYVLVDFWASWCGPCRRENPNVVRVYQKYNQKGFEVLSVSLDSNRDRWLAAIEKDNMTWHHISDLGGWGNSAAKLYGVRSIPRTFLVDPEGRIIASNLRGPALEAKLAEIFGS